MRFDLLSRGDVILPGKVLPGGALAIRGSRIAGILEPGVQADTGDSLEKVGQVREQAHVDVGFYATIATVDGVEAIPDRPAGGSPPVQDRLYETDPSTSRAGGVPRKRSA